MFFKGSRYEGVPTQQHTTAEGRIIRFKAVRVLPEPIGIAKHVVDDGERLDHIAFTHYRDPERFWRLCDGNCVVTPESLARPGDVIDVPPGEG